VIGSSGEVENGLWFGHTIGVAFLESASCFVVPSRPITRFFPLASGANRGYHLSCLPIAAHPGAGTRADGREFRIRVCWSSSQVTLEQ